MSKKNMLLAIFLIVLFSSTYSFASEPYPSKDIEIIVPFAAGGGLDLMSRTLAVQLSDILGTQVIVVNKPGAGGSVGTTLALKSKPDGYTLVTVSPSSILFSPNFKKVEYDPLKDISYIAGWVNQPLGIQVLAESQFKNLNDLLTFAKNNPGKIKYGASFNGYGHIYMEAIAKERGRSATTRTSTRAPTAMPSYCRCCPTSRSPCLPCSGSRAACSVVPARG